MVAAALLFIFLASFFLALLASFLCSLCRSLRLFSEPRRGFSDLKEHCSPSVELVSALMASLIKSSGIYGASKWMIFTLLLEACYLLLITAESVAGASFVSEANTPLAAPAVPKVSNPVNPSSYHRPEKKLSSVNILSPSLPPYHGPLLISQPPSSSHFSKPSRKKSKSAPPLAGLLPPDLADAPTHSILPLPAFSPQASSCCGPNMVLLRGSKDCHCVYPVKIDLLLTNVSQNPNWDLFLREFATGLGLHVSQIELINFYWITLLSLNISMDVTPYTGISFSASTASAINSLLHMHNVNLDNKLVGVGDYKLLNLTWFQAPAPSPAPVVAASPAKAPAAHFPTSNSSIVSKKGWHPSLVLIICLGCFTVISGIVAAFIICSRSTRAAKPTLLSEEPKKMGTAYPAPGGGSLPHPTSTRFLPYEELKQATNNFEPASILGEGGFGRVYKGVLSDGTAVAIKRLTNGGQQGDKEFLVEVEMLSRLHHRNLVKLVGYYYSHDSSQNLLCYELVPNGSLESWLHGPLGVNCPLDWDTRMKIALDAARGLAYLHEDSQPCVIHRDFKASNILLENNFHAKVADFGLAKQAPEGRANYLSTRVMGTFGYVAPEYAMTGHLIVKSDVYSYGVVLLELLTGRKPVDMSQPSGQENLVTWARPILRDKERLEELVDPKLQGKYPKEDFIRVCTIAAACVAPEANQRPTMGEVVQSLKMVQRVTEYQDSTNVRPNLKQSSTTFDSDGTSSMFSSGPYSGVSAFDNDNVSRTTMFSEDLHEGR